MYIDHRTTLHSPDALAPYKGFLEGEGANLADSLLALSKPSNPFESDTVILRNGDSWIIVISNRMTVIIDDDLTNGVTRAVRQHSKMLERLDESLTEKGDY